MSVPLILVSTVAALAGIYLGDSLASRSQVAGAGKSDLSENQDTPAPLFAVPDLFVYPLQAGNALGGYVVIRYALPLTKGARAAHALPDDVVLADAFYAAMFSLRAPGKKPDQPPDIRNLGEKFLNEANGHGVKRFEAALVQQFDIFEPEAMRRKNVRDRKNPEEAEIKDKKPAPKH